MNMNFYLLSAATLTALTALAHSILGERYFLKRLLIHQLPEELEIEAHINRTARTAWHLTSLAWFGLAIILGMVSYFPPAPLGTFVAHAIGILLTVSGLISLLSSRGRHLLGIVFLFIALLIWFGI